MFQYVICFALSACGRWRGGGAIACWVCIQFFGYVYIFFIGKFTTNTRAFWIEGGLVCGPGEHICAVVTWTWTTMWCTPFRAGVGTIFRTVKKGGLVCTLQYRAFALVAWAVGWIAAARVAGLGAAHQLAEHVAHFVVEPVRNWWGYCERKFGCHNR